MRQRLWVGRRWVAPNGPGPPGPWRCPVRAGGSYGPEVLLDRQVPVPSARARSWRGRSRVEGRGPPGGVGSSPLPILWWGQATPSPSPGSVPEPTPADHQRRRMMSRHRDRPSCRAVQRLLPVAAAPHAGPRGIHRDDPQPSVGGHADQQVPELPGRHPSHDPAEGLAAPAAAEGLPTGVAGVGEVEVLHRQRAAAMRSGEPEQLGDRGAQPAIAGAGGLPVEVERDRVGLAEWVAGGSRTQAARWSALRSTPRLRCWRSSSSDGTGRARSRQEAARCQRPVPVPPPLAGSRLMSYLTAPPAACAAHSPRRWVKATGQDSR
jgi:hypothetical protein